MKIFNKERLPNGRRHIYFCGIKIASYMKHKYENHTQTIIEKHFVNTQQVKYMSDDKLQLFLRDKFYEYTGKLPTENLETLNEKIIWMAMFDVTPLKIQCADKYTVRDYVEKQIGKNYLIKIEQSFDDISDICLEGLPDKFVAKFSEGSGKVFLVPEKSKLDLLHFKSVIRQWIINDYWPNSMEMQYKDSVRKIIIEEFLQTKIEYKLWMFHGKCKFIKIEIMNDFAENGKPDNQYGKYFYPDWTPADFRTVGKEPEFDIPKPKSLKELIKCAEKLSEPFDFVRVDFYETNSGELKFGELTFSPAAGNVHFVPEIKNKEFGDMLKISRYDKHGIVDTKRD